MPGVMHRPHGVRYPASHSLAANSGISGIFPGSGHSPRHGCDGRGTGPGAGPGAGHRRRTRRGAGRRSSERRPAPAL